MSCLEPNKFVRRHDLTPSIRLYIAFTALMARTSGIWGTITERISLKVVGFQSNRLRLLKILNGS